MLKHILPIGACAVLAFGACQSASTEIALTAEEQTAWSPVFEAPGAHATDIRLYTQGRRIGDAAVMYDALHNMLAHEPGNVSVKDTLATLYFTGRMYGPSLSLTQELLEIKPQDARYMEMKAVSQNSLGLLEDALVAYQELLAVDPNPYFAYQIATIQYGLNKFDIAEASVDNMLAADLGEQKVNINLTNGRAQSVPMKAALLNIKGVLRKDVHKDLDRAREYFELAMAEAPEFQLPVNNLAALNGK